MKVIPEYMIAQNRPYGASDVYTNLHQEFGKTLVIKCLENAVQSGLLRDKTISKQKIYYANQDRLTTCDDAELTEMDREINQKSEDLSNINAKFKSLTCGHLLKNFDFESKIFIASKKINQSITYLNFHKQFCYISFQTLLIFLSSLYLFQKKQFNEENFISIEVKSLEAQLTTPQLAEAIERLEAELSGMEKRKSELEGNQDSMSADEKKKAEQSVDYYEKLMRQRKRCAEDMIAAISDNYPKKMNILLDEIGVDLD